MQRVMYFLLVLFAVACQKEKLNFSEKIDKADVKLYLKKMVPETTIEVLDWDKMGPLQKNGKLMAFKIPFEGTSPDNYQFLLVNVKDEKLTTVFRNDVAYKANAANQLMPVYVTNTNYQTGEKTEYDLSQAKDAATNPTTALRNVRPRTLVVSGTSLPIVTIVGTYSNGGIGSVIDGTTAYLLAGILGVDGSLTTGGISTNTSSYATLDYLDPLSSNGDSGGSSVTYEVIEWEMDDSDERVAVNIYDYLRCFDRIPDAGASFKVKVMVDIPVDNKPNTLVNIGWSGLSVGHVFIQLTKSNGSQSVTQNLGFYPATGYKSLALTPVESKIVDDAYEPGNYHEYNSSLTLNNFNATEFHQLINQLKSNAGRSYELDDFNCANYVATCLNAVRPGTLTSIPVSGVNPLDGSQQVTVTWTPNGMYKALADLKYLGGPLADNIETSIDNKATQSSGACY